MNRKDLKEYRTRELNIKSEKLTLERQLARLECKSQNIDGMPKAQNKIDYSMEKYLDDKAKIDEEILEQNNLYINQIRSRFKLMNPLYATILREYYINAKPLEEVSTIIEKSYYRTCHLNGEALIEFDNLEKK